MASILTESQNADNAPVSKVDLQECVQKLLTSSEGQPNLIEGILKFLGGKSSLHKFIVHVNSIDSKAESNVGIKNSIGALWDADKDGFIVVEVPREETKLLIQCIWICKN